MFRLNWRWSIDMGKAVRRSGRLGEVRSFLGELYGPELHANRIDALAGATLGVMAGASLAVAMIGHALAQARGLVTKHAVKQVDRLLSNSCRRGGAWRFSSTLTDSGPVKPSARVAIAAASSPLSILSGGACRMMNVPPSACAVAVTSK